MNLCAVVIFFNPTKTNNVIHNVLSYSTKLRKIYIVDNSNEDNKDIVQNIKNVEYISNGKNLGIAAALNIGLTKALKDGFDFAMTMDQDSFFSEDNLDKYIKLVCLHSEKTEIKSFAPRGKAQKEVIPISKLIRFKILSPIKKIILNRHYKIKTFPSLQDIEYPKIVITSGNIINLEIWKRIGRFDNNLFIDEVDHDFCRRLELFNYKIIQFNTVFLDHSLGNPRRTFFKKITYHNDFRYYYIIRNLFIEKERYGKLLEGVEAECLQKIKRYFKDYCILDIKALIHFFIFLRAYIDARKFLKSDNFLKNIIAQKG